MPDIAMCDGTFADGTKCPLRHDCYRHEANPSGLNQSWFSVAPPLLTDGTCEYRMPLFPSEKEGAE